MEFLSPTRESWLTIGSVNLTDKPNDAGSSIDNRDRRIVEAKNSLTYVFGAVGTVPFP